MKEKLTPLPTLKKKLHHIWSLKVRNRDKKCVLCGTIDKQLYAHHYIKNAARSIKYRYDLRNGVALCYACHRFKVHKTASFDIVSALVNYALKNEILTDLELSEIVHDNTNIDYVSREYLEAIKIELEQKNEM